MIVDVDDLHVRFRRGAFRAPLVALDGLSLGVREGEFFGLLGQNGAGKSTALHCLLGLLRPTKGRVRVMGQVPEPGAEVFAHVGYLPEEPRYHDYLTVEEAVTYYAALSGVAATRTRVAEALERLGLTEHRRLTLRRCSKGMKQKVGIAQCLMHQPRLLILDEPMRGLDPMTVHAFRAQLVDMNRKGTTVIMSSHVLAEVELVATRVAILHRGRLVVEDEIARLMRSDRDIYVVEIESAADVPPHLADVVRTNGSLHGTLPAAALYEFMDYARARELRIVSCARRKATLEECFLAIVTEGSDA